MTTVKSVLFVYVGYWFWAKWYIEIGRGYKDLCSEWWIAYKVELRKKDSSQERVKSINGKWRNRQKNGAFILPPTYQSSAHDMVRQSKNKVFYLQIQKLELEHSLDHWGRIIFIIFVSLARSLYGQP